MSETKKLRLLKPHTHGQQRYRPGDVIELPTRIADWLIAQHVADEVIETAAAKSAAPVPVTVRARKPCCGRSR